MVNSVWQRFIAYIDDFIVTVVCDVTLMGKSYATLIDEGEGKV